MFNNNIQQTLGGKKQDLLYLHAVTGCDTTLARFRQGKAKTIRLLRSRHDDLVKEMTMFNGETASHDDVALAREDFLISLYGEAKFITLSEYRYCAFTLQLHQLQVQLLDIVHSGHTSRCSNGHKLILLPQGGEGSSSTMHWLLCQLIC